MFRGIKGEFANRADAVRAGPCAAAGSAVFLYLVLFIWPAVPNMVSGPDQWIVFDLARRMAGGERLYSDIFRFTLPGTEFLYLELIKLFGPRVAVLNAMLVASGAAMVWLGVSIGRAVLPGWKAVLPALLFLCFGLYYTLDASNQKFSVLLVYGATAVMVRRRDPIGLVCTGLLTGLATCFTQTRAVMAVVFAVYLAWLAATGKSVRGLLRDEIYLLLPFVLVVGALCGAMMWYAGGGEFIRQTVLFPLKYYRADRVNTWSALISDRPMEPGWGYPLALADYLMLAVMVPAVYLLFIFYYWLEGMPDQEPWPALMLIAWAGTGLFVTVAYAPTWPRLCEISLPAFIVSAWFVDRWRLPVLAGAGWIAAAAMLLVMPLKTQLRHYHYIAAPTGTVAIHQSQEAGMYQYLVDNVSPGEFFFQPGTPVSNVILAARDPAPVPTFVNNEYTRPEQVSATLTALNAHPPRLIVWDLAPPDSYKSADRLGPLADFVLRHYRYQRTMNSFQVWKLDRPAPAERRADGYSN